MMQTKLLFLQWHNHKKLMMKEYLIKFLKLFACINISLHPLIILIKGFQLMITNDEQMLFIVKLYYFLDCQLIIEYLMVIILYYSLIIRWSLNDYFCNPTSIYCAMFTCTIFEIFDQDVKKNQINSVFIFMTTFSWHAQLIILSVIIHIIN
ncbi:unnamed protein product [Paramecium primaurelia]|uniref:Transmembrane protein n=1 Tax=Paramecium primaurelia TaxID=5886 RepID=A0A8S1PEG4_PARPR|nr:unnamed protein product [Paramecium primaurelia]